MKTPSIRPLTKFLFVFLFFSLAAAYGQNKQAVYGGTVEYDFGAFGGFDPPRSGDSVVVTVNDNKKIFVRIFDRKYPERDRYMNFDPAGLELEKKEMYTVIETPTKSWPSGNFDLKFSSGKAGGSSWKNYIQLKHYSDGQMAYLTITGEQQGFIGDLLNVKLNKVK